MRQSSKKIFGEQKNILEVAGQMFTTIPIKVNKSALSGETLLKAGTIIDKTGQKVNDATAFGIVYEDVDFTDTKGTEVVPVLVFGFVKESALPVQPETAAKTALKMILFL